MSRRVSLSSKWYESISLDSDGHSQCEYHHLSTADDVSQLVQLNKQLGKGSFAVVYRGYLASRPGLECAIKVIKRRGAQSWRLNEVEINILAKCNHPNIIKLYEVIETPKACYIALELCLHGDLQSMAQTFPDKIIPEPVVATITAQLADAIAYLHRHEIAHRDIKCENCLVRQTPRDVCQAMGWEVCLTDFGLAADSSEEKRLHTVCGTLETMAPEVLQDVGLYSPLCDVWSLGIVIHTLLTGVRLFRHDEAEAPQDMYQHIMKMGVPLKDKHLSNQAKEALKHPFITRGRVQSTKTIFELIKEFTPAHSLQHRSLSDSATGMDQSRSSSSSSTDCIHANESSPNNSNNNISNNAPPHKDALESERRHWRRTKSESCTQSRPHQLDKWKKEKHQSQHDNHQGTRVHGSHKSSKNTVKAKENTLLDHEHQHTHLNSPGCSGEHSRHLSPPSPQMLDHITRNRLRTTLEHEHEHEHEIQHQSDEAAQRTCNRNNDHHQYCSKANMNQYHRRRSISETSVSSRKNDFSNCSIKTVGKSPHRTSRTSTNLRRTIHADHNHLRKPQQVWVSSSSPPRSTKVHLPPINLPPIATSPTPDTRRSRHGQYRSRRLSLSPSWATTKANTVLNVSDYDDDDDDDDNENDDDDGSNNHYHLQQQPHTMYRLTSKSEVLQHHPTARDSTYTVQTPKSANLTTHRNNPTMNTLKNL